MKYYTDLDIYGHLSLNLSTDIDTNGPFNNLSTSNISFIRFTSDAPVVSGFADGNDNNKILLVNYAGSGSLLLKNLSTLSNINNRINTTYGRDIELLPNESVILIYDSTEDVLKWKAVSLPNTVKSITGTANQISVTNANNDLTLSLPQNINTAASPTFAGLILNSTSEISFNTNNNLVISSTNNITLTAAETDGKVTISRSTASSSKTTGALVINGGVGIGGSLYANQIYENTYRVITVNSSIDDLNDVNLSAKQNNYIIAWNSTTSNWEAKSFSAIGTDTLADVTGRGATTSTAISITNTTDSTSTSTGALTVSGGIGVEKRIYTKNLSIDGVKQRVGFSSVLTNGTINLLNSDYLVFEIDQTSTFLSNISFTNGTAGEFFYVKIKSNGQQYTWDSVGNSVKWPSGISPTASQSSKTDLYHFLCLSANSYLGAYVFNYD